VGVAPHSNICVGEIAELKSRAPSDPHPGPPHKGEGEENKMISGLSHLTFIVHDLEKMTRIIVEVLGGQEVYASGVKQHSISPEKFFDVGGIWIAIMQGDPQPTRTYNHVAFKVSPEQLTKAKLAIEALGLDLRESRPRVSGEGQSLYFHDYDNHLLELHTGSLGERLAAYKKLDEL
jgi:fosfomycin resistance protein FosX